MEQKVISLIVTYGDRAHFVERIVSELFAQGVSCIVIVDNGSVDSSAQKLKKLSSLHGSSIYYHRLEENMGSAGGFGCGIKFVRENCDFDFLWILDDDNLPKTNALQALLQTKNSLSHSFGSNVVLYSYRGEAWRDDLLAVNSGKIKGYSTNNFIGFTIGNTIKSFLKKEGAEINYPVARTTLGPYGGMFLNVGALDAVGFPESKFFLYADDHEYTLRFNQAKINQFLVYASELEDLDSSFQVKNRYFSKESSEFKLFYSIRNHVYLSQSFRNSDFLYFLNKWSFISVILLRSFSYILRGPSLYLRRLLLLKRAINDGEKGLLGSNF